MNAAREEALTSAAAPGGKSPGVAVLSPVGRDAPLMLETLAAANIPVFAVPSAPELLRVVAEEVNGLNTSGLGVILTPDEALAVESSARLVEILDRQPPWSDIPIVLLAGSGRPAETFYAGPVAERLPLGGSVTVLDRPVRMAALVSAVRAAMRARARQIEVRDLIAARDRAVADVERANRAKSEYLAVMSHELRTPLNAIVGHVQLMEIGLHGPITPAQREALKKIDRAQRYILRMLNDLLDYARIEAGRLEYRMQSVPLAGLVGEVLSLVEAQFATKGLSYAARLPDREVIVRADPDRLRPVLLNLLSNAAKFTPSGGHVEVTADSNDRDGPAGARIEVLDTGAGIPADKLDVIFEPFVQAHVHLPAERERGTGLGLAISREMVRAMVGKLTAASLVGCGSTFTVTLPLGAGGGSGRSAPEGPRPV